MIMATHFAIVLGAWRLRVRIDLDEPRDEAPGSGTAADDRAQARSSSRERTHSAVSSSRWN
jgi:hypothetical protein